MPSSGFVYVMSRDNGHVKVGFSTDPHRRLSEVDGARSILALWQHESAFRIEQMAHRLLGAEYRQDGEWFAADRFTVYRAIVTAMERCEGNPTAGITGYPLPPMEEVPPDGRYRVGYGRPLPSVPAGQQMSWMLAMGAVEQRIYISAGKPDLELASAIKDARETDIFLAWCPEVFGANLEQVQGALADKGAELVYAV
jgi:hypothetical protein